MAELPRNLAANPLLSRWIEVRPDGTIEVRIGKVELGQGIVTALAQIAADELGVDLGAIRMMPAGPDGPDEGITAGSLSIMDSGAALRIVAANVRARFAAVAGRPDFSYADLAASVPLDVPADAGVAVRGRGAFVGWDVPRLDLPDKIFGRPRYIHDLRMPGQWFGRVVRPPSPGARLLSVDLGPDGALVAPAETPITTTSVGDVGIRGAIPTGVASPSTDGQSTGAAAPGPVAAGTHTDERPVQVTGGHDNALSKVRLVRDGSFLGVLGPDEAVVVRAAEIVRRAARWAERDLLPDETELEKFLRSGPHETIAVIDDGAEPPADDRSLAASYSRPFLAHASMAPSCGIAMWTGPDRVDVWSHSQGIYPLGRAIAAVLGIDPARVRVQHVEGAGCYGHNGADDAAFDAVLLARAVPGTPVQVLWSRQDELAWAPLGSAMTADVQATLSADGRLSSWTYDLYSQGHTARPGYAGVPGLLAATFLEPAAMYPAAADPPAAAGYGSARNALPGYDLPRRRVTGHRLTSSPIRSSAMRALGAHFNVFAIESFMDEAAELSGADPLEFRLAHLGDRRGRRVLETAAEAAGWGRSRPDGTGLGLGYARYKERGAYCAVVAEAEAETNIRVRRIVIAVDVGQVINPDGVRNQIEGGAVQSASWTLTERVRFDRRRITSDTWETYPILRFSQTPAVHVTIVESAGDEPVGAGEAAQGPTAAAIANAVSAAVGVRVRDLPLTTDAVVAAIEASS